MLAVVEVVELAHVQLQIAEEVVVAAVDVQKFGCGDRGGRGRGGGVRGEGGGPEAQRSREVR